MCKGRGGGRAKACQAEFHSRQRTRKLCVSPWRAPTERFDPVEIRVLGWGLAHLGTLHPSQLRGEKEKTLSFSPEEFPIFFLTGFNTKHVTLC